MKKIIHFCNYSPIDSGIYPETRDLVCEELRRGYDAYIVDHIRDNPFRMDAAYHDALFKDGRIIGLEHFDETEDADLICWHSWIPDSYMADPSRDIVMFLHAMPSHLFYNELYGGEAVLTFMKDVHLRVPNCRYYITLWPTHERYWENIISGNLVVTNPIISCDCIQPKADTHFDPSHLKLVVMDTWRAGKEPYYIMNSIQILMRMADTGKLPFKVSLNVYGQEAQNVQSVWQTLIHDDFKRHIQYKGKKNPQHIFDINDILLTQVGEIPTESRVIREGLLSGIPIVAGIHGVDWTPYQHDCRDIEGYADKILSCWEDMQDQTTRKALHNKNRAYVRTHYDIRRHADPLFECYENIFNQSAVSKTEPAGPATVHKENENLAQNIFEQFKGMLQEIEEDTPLEALLQSLQNGSETMNSDEALVRLMMDLPKSG